MSEAIRGVGATKGAASETQIRGWFARYEAKGLVGLIDRVGRLASLDAPDPPTPNRGPRNSRTKKAVSFVKWVGSKKGVLPELLARAPRDFRRYFEPMVGSGVLYFSMKPKEAVLSDANPELMLTYRVIRDSVEELILALGHHRNTREDFYRVRALSQAGLDPVQVAARFIYLNKTCFNGLYRVNKDGRFNVPYGRDERANYQDVETLRKLSAQLQGATLRCGDFAEACAEAAEGDLVYLDPPYLPRSSQRLIRYRSQNFGELDHRRLAGLVRELDQRGCLVMVSNSNLPLIHKLYSGYRIEVLRLRRSVNARASERRGWDELLIRNFDLEEERPRRKVGARGGKQQLSLPLG